MTSLLDYAKAVAICATAAFVTYWCVTDLMTAFYLYLYTICFLLGLAGVIAAITTVTFMFYDWKHKRDEESDSA